MQRLLPFLCAWFLQAQSPPIAITGVNIVDVATGRVVPDRTVMLSGGRIASIGDSSAAPPSGAALIDARGYYLMPGLWDMHVHFRNNPVDSARMLAEDNAALLELFLLNGIVGVREMGGDLSDHVLLWRNQIRDGRRIGPRILTAGRKLDLASPVWPGSISSITPDEGRQAVRQMKQAGADFIKIYYTELDSAVLSAITAEAHTLGLKVTGHLPSNISLRTAHELNVDGLEHAMYLRTPLPAAHGAFAAERLSRKTDLPMDTAEVYRRLIWMHDAKEAEQVYALMAKKPFYITPTLVVESRVRYEIAERDFSTDPRKRYFFPAIWSSWDVKSGRRQPPAANLRDLFKRAEKQNRALMLAAHKAGVPLLAGTDTGVANNYVLPGFSIHEELQALVDAGLSPAEALRTATVNPARWRGEESAEGTVEKGKRADLVLLRSNPLSHIASTREIEAVFRNGEYLNRAKLDAMLLTVESRAAAAWKKSVQP